MTKAEPSRAEAPPLVRLHSVRFAEETSIAHLQTVRHLVPGVDKGKGYELGVAGAAVYVLLPEIDGARQVVEVPRIACVLRWQVDPSAPLAELVGAIQGAAFAHAR